MNKNIKKIIKSKASKRIISGVTAFIMFFGMMPLGDIKDTFEDMDLFSISATAVDIDAEETDPRFMADKDANGFRHITVYPSLLVEYSKHCAIYKGYHQYDIITITTSGNENMQAFNYGFQGIGSEARPFGGSIEIGSSNEAIVLNLDAPLFNCVYDNVTLTNNGGAFKIAREFDLDQTQISSVNDKLPLLAKSVRHNENGTPAIWNIEVTRPTAGNNKYLCNFGGFIGEMSNEDGDTSLTVNITMNTVDDDAGDIVVAGTSNSDIGLICGSMDEGTTLNFTLSGNRKVNSLTTTYGHAGGLVGSMSSGAVLNYTGTNIQNNNTVIKTTASDKYAGGIVGYNEGGTVKFTLPSGVTAYPITQTISGTDGAGGVYGYYKPGSIETEDEVINALNSEIDTSKYAINCQVNGTGYDGGLFGVLEIENAQDYTISHTNTVTSTHSSGNATGYGGLIGRYNNSDLSNKLDIGAVTAASTKESSASYYGGAIAFVGESITDEGETSGGSSYVKLNGFTANATSADEMTFGGIAAKADNAFIDVNNVTINITGDKKFKGGAVVGSLQSGVLRMTGVTDITNALADGASYKAGQIVGYRDNALIFAYSGTGNDVWKLKRPNTSITVDDIGSWGEIIRFNVKDTSTDGETKYGFGSDATVITVNESDHTVTIAAPSFDESDGSIVLVSSSSDFAKAALNMQLESNSDVLQRYDTNDYLSSNIKLGADLTLTGLGISSFTRDNAETDSNTADKCVYSGTFNGNGHSVTLAIGEPYGYHGDTLITDHSVEGSGKIYRHKYNGLFGITSSSSGDDDGNNAKNVTFKGKITVKANDTVYIGSVSGLATNVFKVDSVNMIDTIASGNHSTEFKIEGSKSAYVGGLIGKVTSDVDNLSIKDCNIKLNINSSNTEGGSCYGGVIGWINHSTQTADWDFNKVTVSGSITRIGKHQVNKLGGLVAAIEEYKNNKSEREIELTDINISGLSISAVGSDASDKDSSVGGLLGYSWLNVNPTFHNVQINSGSSVTLSGTASKKGDLAGMVYQGTGHWIIEPSSITVTDEDTSESTTTHYDGINIDDITVTSANAKSFGMIVNNGTADNSAIFLDIRADDNANSKKSYIISSATLTDLDGRCIFDELVAYSAADGKVLENGQGIVSVHTGLTTDGTNSSKTYQAQTSRGAVPNNKTRYYYDLDTIREDSGDKDLLMRWALNLYAHKSLSDYFTTSWVTDTTNNVSAIPYGTYDMVNCSWYPINISGTVTVNGEFKFYNNEFEKSEAAKGGTYTYTRTSLYDSTEDKATQHHLMHCGLFYNVSGGVTIGTSGITLQGNVGRYGKKTSSSDNKVSGALICGTIKGGSTSSIATFTTNGNINLGGIYVHDHNSNSYAPLLINKIGEFSTIVVKNVKATSSSYTDDFKAASSLIGDVGSSTATNINLTFADIQIDGRKTSDAYSLNDVYNTKSSLFYRASLLNTFRYASGSATYDYNIGDDWKTSGDSYTKTGANGVTYGSEIDDANSQHLGREYWYKDTNGGIYTNYNTPGASGTGAPSPAISFAGFLPYVYDKCTATTIETAEDKKYQIKVNWADAPMTGCGTYNDPYIITSGDDFVKIANILNGDKSLTISLPKIARDNSVNATKLKQKKWDDYGHTDFTGDGTNYISTADSSKSYTPTVVQNYLAGAYYKIQSNTTITLPSDFAGFCNQNNEQATFRGVIVGNGETITLTGDNPLIYQSNGSVIKGINIVVNKSTITLNQGNPTTFAYGTSGTSRAYGAVIGKIMGGDNIIDDVTVSFGTSKIKLTGNSAQTIPVGGYVGVVVKGTLVFRGMEKYRESESLWNSISGLKATTVIDNSSNSNLLYTDASAKTPNMKWLYVNPIVGRVINAAVFTEGSAYRPFEDGTREGVYIKSSSEEADPENNDDYTSIAVETNYEKYSQPVTMQNGTKNYSIADITDKLAMFTTNTPQRNSTFMGNADFRRYLTVDIGIPNAQSLFIMSLVTQSGLGATNYLQRYDRDNAKETENNNYYPNNYAKPVGGFLNTGNWGIAPYYKYRATHVAEYTYVGNCGGGGIPEPTSDKAWYDDYTKAKTDNAQFNRTGTENNHKRAHAVEAIPYIIGKYTPKIPNDTSGMTLLISNNDDQKITNFQTNYLSNINGKELGYIAFCLTHQYTYLNLTFEGTSSVYYMPDGFRGLGTLGYNNYLSGDATSVYQDLIVHLFELNGNNKTVNLNMNLYAYHYITGTSYDSYLISSSSPGFGFMDAMMQNKDSADDNIAADQEKNQIHDLTLTGIVNYDIIKAADGSVYKYDNTLTANGNERFWATGGLAGNVVYNSGAAANISGVDIFKISINNINLSNLRVSGTKSTGGLIGYNQSYNSAESKTTIKNINTSNLEVSSGIYTGGLIGYTTQTAVEVSDVTIAEPNIKSNLSFSTNTKLSTNATGGIIGYAATGTENGPVYLHDITVGTESPNSGYSAYIGYTNPATYPTNKDNETVKTGGLIGQVFTNSSTMINAGTIDYNTKIEKCNVYNVDIYGHQLGGVIGSVEDNSSGSRIVHVGIIDTIVMSNPVSPKTIYGAKYATGAAGGIIGYTSNLDNKLTIQNSKVEGYKIESKQQTGGLVGTLSGSNSTCAKINDVMVKDIKITSDSFSGGLIGNLDKPINGYNILTDNIQFTGALSNHGHIVGKLNNGSTKPIKIAGFSRRNMSNSVSGYNQQEQMVGNIADAATNNSNKPYGENGYVIFADYYNTYNNSNMSTVASTVNSIDTNNNTSNVDKNTYSVEDKTDTQNNFPYVTVSPKKTIESSANGLFLTGDAVIELTYNDSVFKKIFDHKTTQVAGYYKNTPNLSDTEKANIASKFSTSSVQVPGTPNIPLLVIEDTDNTAITNTINNYIRTLTNTKTTYNFAKDESGIYHTSLNKCEYNKSTGTYSVGIDGSACLKRNQIGTGWYFRMTSDDVDNATEGVFQFSLLDIQFFDPSDTTRIAYHLYVPIYVKKLLQYDFKAAMVSNTDYYLDPYGSLNGNSLFENLGNPVTMKFEYIYKRGTDEWKDAINGGETVLQNLYKTISVDGGAWPTGTRMVLVDANNNDKHYYLDNPSSSGTLALHDFVDNSGEHYDPAPLNNIMTVTVGQPTSVTRTLTPVSITSTDEIEKKKEISEKKAIVYSNGVYYRLITDDDSSLTDSDKYAVTNVVTDNTERYYLSIFIPKAENAPIYHYQFTGSDNFDRITVDSSEEAYKNDGYRPNHITDTNAVVHFYTGDLYDNTFTMSVTSKKNDRELNKGNNQLKVTMTSTIQLKSVESETEGIDPNSTQYDKTRKGLAQNMYSNRTTSEIYQAFLSTYDRKDTADGLSNVSINMQAPPFAIIKDYKYYEGTDTSGTANTITAPDPNPGITENYVPLVNNVNIINSLYKEANNYAITFTLEYELNYYDENYIFTQFPENISKSEEIGTKVIGYSNISSSRNSVAYSATSKKSENSPRYYASGTSKATLKYNVVKTSGEMSGPYSYLGINPLDTQETEHEIKTVAQYDAHSLTSSGDYIEFSIKLSNKSSNYSTDLPLSSYIKSLEILGTSNDKIFDSSWADGSEHVSNKVLVTKTDTEYKIRAHKSVVQKQGSDDGERYLFPINYTVYTGDTKFNNNTGGLMYSNYKVSVHAEIWSAKTGGTRTESSVADSDLIYTNAKINPDVIKVH